MGTLQRTPGKAPTAFSQDYPWLRRRERISLVKNRMREICTSGSVRGGGGNVPTYSAIDLAQWRQIGLECTLVGEPRMIVEELQAAGVVGRDQHLQKQPAEQRRENL